MKWTKTNSEETARATFLMYGMPGAGKTTLATTLPRSDDGRVIYAAADPGQLVLRGCAFNACKLDTIKDLADLREFLTSNGSEATKKNVDWLIVDGLDECADIALRYFQSRNKDGRAAYGEMADFMAIWTKALRDLPCNVLFITHIGTDIDDAGARYYRPAFPGKQTHQVLVNWFDFVGCLRFVPDSEGKQRRMIQFKGEADPRYTVKERGYESFRLGEWEAPDMTNILNKLGLNKFKGDSK